MRLSCKKPWRDWTTLDDYDDDGRLVGYPAPDFGVLAAPRCDDGNVNGQFE